MPCAHLLASIKTNTTMNKLLRLAFPAFIILGCGLFTVTSCGDDEGEDTPPETNANKNQNATDKVKLAYRLEFPKLKEGNTIVLVHTTNDKDPINLSIEWDADKKAQRWTAYRIHKGQTGSFEGSNSFTEDPDLPASARVSGSNSFYSGSGFDRGHICPNADRRYSKLANQQTYYYTNMQPQYHMFNAGPRLSNGDQNWERQSPWLRLEGKVRTWGRSNACDTLYIVKGGTIEDDQLLKNSTYPQGKIKGQLPIPKYFFVALLMKSRSDYKAIGFWIEHDNIDHADNSLTEYAKSIDELEALTGIDFFCNLPDDIENKVEAKYSTSQWSLNN